MRLINADKLNARLSRNGTPYYTVPDIENAPPVDAVPVVHTQWAHIGGDEWCCPTCGFVISTEGSWDNPTKKYCENCGAKMDGGADDAAD